MQQRRKPKQFSSSSSSIFPMQQPLEEKKKKPLSTPQELLSHYESQGMTSPSSFVAALSSSAFSVFRSIPSSSRRCPSPCSTCRAHSHLQFAGLHFVGAQFAGLEFGCSSFSEVILGRRYSIRKLCSPATLASDVFHFRVLWLLTSSFCSPVLISGALASKSSIFFFHYVRSKIGWTLLTGSNNVTQRPLGLYDIAQRSRSPSSISQPSDAKERQVGEISEHIPSRV